MQVDFYGLALETPGVTFYLWYPWRCTMLEHKLFESVRGLPNVTVEITPEEQRVHVSDVNTWKTALTNLSRVLKGWQEEASDAGVERRSWRWLLEADVDASGYDMEGEKASLWAFVRTSLDRGGPADMEKGEEVDLTCFGLRFWGIERE